MKTLLLALLLFGCASQGAKHPASVPPRCPDCDEALGREEQGARDTRFEPVFSALLANFEKPDEDHDWKIGDYELLGAVRGIVQRDLSLRDGATVTNAKMQPVPVEIFLSFRRQLAHVFAQGFSIPYVQADALAESVEREALASAFIPEKDFEAASGRKFGKEAALTAPARAAGEALFRTTTFELRFDVPFIAGYAPDDEKFIFIDRHVPASGVTHGKKIPAKFLLNVHERVEKLLLDRFGLIYQHAHQIAQRSERRVAKSFGLGWEEYDEWMSRVTKNVGKNRPLLVSPRLELTPYYSYTEDDDLALVEAIRESVARANRN